MKTIRVKVRPNAGKSSLEAPGEDGLWHARLKSPPVDGRANAELAGLIARYFGCRRADVTIRSGAAGRVKLIRIEDA